jgi:integrase
MSKKTRSRFGTIRAKKGRRGLYIRVRYQGQERRRFAGTNKATARQLLARIEARLPLVRDLDLVMNEVFGQPRLESTTFAQVAARFLDANADHLRGATLDDYELRMRAAGQTKWAKLPIQRVTATDITRWLDQLRVDGGPGGKRLAPSTLNRYRSFLSVVFNYAVSLGHCPSNVVSDVPPLDERGRAREEFLMPAEARALLDACSGDLRLIVFAAMTTGLRRGTLLKLRWRDVDLEHGFLLVHASITKGKRAQRVPLIPELVDALAARRSENVEAPVFTGAKGGPWNPNVLWRQYRDAVDGCEGIPEEKRPKICFHSLRHTFASLLILGGMHQRIVQEALGHSDPKLTARYSHLSPQGMEEIVTQLRGLFGLGQIEQVNEPLDRWPALARAS